jgi:ABC-type transport system involved in multi-copper enzyme maturation permease subunit
MVVENEVLPYLQWLWRGDGAAFVDGRGALVQFGIVALTVFVLALVGGFVVSLVRHGPVRAGEITYRTLVGGFGDLFRFSPQRIGALASLAIKESLRRRVWVALVVFAMILLFASWYLGTNNREPARLYLSFVTTATSYLMLLLSLGLAAFSLPNDIKQKTIYTVATKPVRSIDIVLGRIIGFTALGSVLLAIMAVASWFFVNGALAHTHTVDKATLEAVRDADGATIGKDGETTYNAYHSHPFSVDADGAGVTDTVNEHYHQLSSDGSGEIVVGPAEGYLRARVPLRGTLHFLNQQGVPVAKGISVGNEWAYRSFIQGATQASAVWTFNGVNDKTLMEYEGGEKYLPVSLIVRVYRSYKGIIEQAIQGSIQLRNPDTGVKSTLRIFPAKDAQIDSFEFANEQTDTDQNDITILDDLVTKDGRIEVIVQCLDRGQYFGFAQADCFIRLPEGLPLANFVKGFLAIWMMMVIVIAVAVLMSTFLSGPIAMVAAITFIILGFFRAFFVQIALGESYGGGPVESLVRIVTQMNVMSPFDPSPAVSAMQGVDNVLKGAMRALSNVLPDFSTYLDRVRYVADGFAIPTDAVLQDLTVTLAYVVGMAIVGYFCLRTREMAKA